MTAALEKRRKETLERRAQKVDALYREKAINVLKNAEEYFVIHPRVSSYVETMKISQREANIFYPFLRKLAMDKNWNLYVARSDIFFGRLTIDIYSREPQYEEPEKIEEEYLWMLSELVKD